MREFRRRESISAFFEVPDQSNLRPAVREALEQAAKAHGARYKIFDWDRAAELLRDVKSGRARAGLKEDWGWTNGTIMLDGKVWTDLTAYLASYWATPIMRTYETGNDKEIECWRYKDKHSANWDRETVWPDSALAIFNKK